MKKISNITQLKIEKDALEHERTALEESIRQDWYGIKETLRPKNVTGQVLSAMFSKPEPGEKKSIIPWLISLSAAGLAGKVLAVAKKKLTKWLT